MVGAAAVGYYGSMPKRQLLYHLGPMRNHTVFEAEAIGLLLATWIIKTTRNVASATIHTDNQAAIQAVTTGHSNPGAYIFDRIHDMIARIRRSRPSLLIHVTWVPAHSNVPRNEMADTTAKSAAAGTSSPAESLPPSLRKPLPNSLTTERLHLHNEMAHHLRRLAQSSPRHLRIHELERDPADTMYRRLTLVLNRTQLSLLTQIRTGHAPPTKTSPQITNNARPHLPPLP